MRKTAKNKVLRAAVTVCAALVMLAGCSGTENSGDNPYEGGQNAGGNPYEGSQNAGGNEPVSPLTIKNHRVISCDKTTEGSVEIPAGVEIIGNYAFSGCYGVTSVTIPTGVEIIGDYAFSDCSGLTSVTIPETVYYIRDYAFNNCLDLRVVKILAGMNDIGNVVNGIGNFVFRGSMNLTVYIPSSFKDIEPHAFAGCSGLTVQYAGTKAQWEKLGVNTEYVTVVCSDGMVGEEPDTYYTVTFHPNVPAGATGAEKLVAQTRTYNEGSGQQIPEGLFTLDGYRLAGWATNADDSTVSYLTGSFFDVWEDRSFYAVWEAVDISVNGVIIKDSVVVDYRPDSGVTAVTIPGGVTAIGDSAFSGCAGVTSVAIPYGVTSIGSSAFDGCTGLVSVEIPASVTSVGSGAFSGCSNLTVYYNGTRAQWELLGIETYGVPVICADDGQGSENQPAVLTVENRVVVKCDPSATGYIEIQPGVTGIAANAFSNCVSIKGVVIPEGVTSIGNGAFRYCSDMLSVEIPGSVTYIGDRAFEYCNRLEEVNFTGTVSQLAALGLDTKGIKDMGTVSVTVNYGKPGQGLCHFVDSGDSTLTGYVIIPSGVTTIGSMAFNKCTGITGVGIPGNVTEIGAYAFNGCINLTSIEIPNGVTEIWLDAFASCINLASITIPSSVISVGEYAFGSCMFLTSIIFNGTIAQWNNISKDSKWDVGTGNYTITCTDGTISKE